MQFGIHFGKAKGHSKAIVNFTKNIFINFKIFIPKHSRNKPFLNQSMASGQPLEIFQRLKPHPVYNTDFSVTFCSMYVSQ